MEWAAERARRPLHHSALLLNCRPDSALAIHPSAPFPRRATCRAARHTRSGARWRRSGRWQWLSATTAPSRWAEWGHKQGTGALAEAWRQGMRAPVLQVAWSQQAFGVLA